MCLPRPSKIILASSLNTTGLKVSVLDGLVITSFSTVGPETRPGIKDSPAIKPADDLGPATNLPVALLFVALKKSNSWLNSSESNLIPLVIFSSISVTRRISLAAALLISLSPSSSSLASSWMVLSETISNLASLFMSTPSCFAEFSICSFISLTTALNRSETGLSAIRAAPLFRSSLKTFATLRP